LINFAHGCNQKVKIISDNYNYATILLNDIEIDRYVCTNSIDGGIFIRVLDSPKTTAFFNTNADTNA